MAKDSESIPRGRVLSIAGSDPSGGAGIQADIKTITALGGYAASAITALTAQNTTGVFGIYDVSPDFITRQIELVLSDIGADAIKTGMLHKAEVIETVAASLKNHAGIPLIVDPVMMAKGGASLLEAAAIEALKTRLIPVAQLVTPNVPEAELLSGIYIPNVAGMIRAGQEILKLGAKAVLVKGGHLAGPKVTDILVTAQGEKSFESERINTKHTHGTGCTLASAIATGIAQKLPVDEAVRRARDYVWEAIKQAPGYGKGNGPLWHGHTVSIF